MTTFKGYLLDLDGTMYRGGKPFPEAVEFVKKLAVEEIPYLFVTNNSTTSPLDVSKRLQQMGIPCEEENILTSSLAAATYMKDLPFRQTAYLIGEPGLKEAIKMCGIEEVEEHPGFVVVGLDRQFTYNKLAKASQAIRAGAHFLSTNRDEVIPTEQGLMPGNGAITSAVAAASGKSPVFIGKPEKIMIDQAVEKMGLPRSELVLIGDNYDTDILAGIRAGIATIHVDTGVTRAADLHKKEQLPTYCIATLSDWGI